jgi:hypothetical protein
MSNLGIAEKNGKFIVIDVNNGQQVLLPKSNGANIVTEFSTREDAQTYASILERLSKRKKYQNS